MLYVDHYSGDDRKVKKKIVKLFFFVLFSQVLMMVVPLIFIVIMPKLINTQDPEIQKVSSHQIYNFTNHHSTVWKF